MGVPEGPMIASIIKPSLGLLPDETAAVVRTLCEAGVDFIKDDEKLMSPGYSPLAARVAAIMPVIRDHEQPTGKQGDVRLRHLRRRPRRDAAQPRPRRRGRRQRRGGQHQLDRPRRHELPAQALGALPARPPQRLGPADPPPRLRHRLPRLPEDLAPARRRPVPDQRHPRQVLGAGRELRALVRRLHDPDLLARPTARCRWSAPASGAARRRRPTSAPAARST